MTVAAIGFLISFITWVFPLLALALLSYALALHSKKNTGAVHFFFAAFAAFCCNVLIYLQKQLQERVLDMLYGALAAPGYLVLGEVETPPAYFSGRLECLDSKAKIYKKVD